MPLNKPDAETVWDNFVGALAPALHRASRRFRQRYGRRVALGSPVKISGESSDVIRIPVEVRGGDTQYAVATVIVNGGLQTHYDGDRLERIAREAARLAEEHPLEPPAVPGAMVLTYP